MYIVIVGCGKVGETLADTLRSENHEVTIVDKDPNVTETVSTRLDIGGVCGNGATESVLREAEADRADLLIAVTLSDEINMLVCLMAKKVGVKSTIARIRNPEYIGQLPLFREELGLSLAINPEFEAAAEISHALRLPASLEFDTFARGLVEIFKFDLTSDSPICNISVKEIYPKIKLKVLICAVERDGKSFIPNGDFKLLEGDRVGIVVPKTEQPNFFKTFGMIDQRTDNVIIVGGGKIAYYLSEMLCNDGIKVKLVEKNRERCEELSEALDKAVILDGNCDEHQLLIDEGLETCGAFVALTEGDEENVLLSFFAKSKSNCKRITKVNHHALASLCKNLDVGSIVTPKLITAEKILKYVRAMQNTVDCEIESLYRLNEHVEALEFKISKESKYVDVSLANLKIKKNFIVACINRNGKTIIPGGSDSLMVGDRVIVVTTEKGLSGLLDIFED